jgi:hypothetical protein
MAKYYKRMLTYCEVLENGEYIAITPLISCDTITIGKGFHESKMDKEITKEEFNKETSAAKLRLFTNCSIS